MSNDQKQTTDIVITIKGVPAEELQEVERLSQKLISAFGDEFKVSTTNIELNFQDMNPRRFVEMMAGAMSEHYGSAMKNKIQSKVSKKKEV